MSEMKWNKWCGVQFDNLYTCKICKHLIKNTTIFPFKFFVYDMFYKNDTLWCEGFKLEMCNQWCGGWLKDSKICNVTCG